MQVAGETRNDPRPAEHESLYYLQIEREGRTDTQGRLYLKFGAMGMNDPPRQIEAEANAGNLLPGCVTTTAKLLEYSLEIVGMDAVTVIDDLDPCAIPVDCGTQLDRRSRRGIFRRVLEQVAQHLTDTVRVCPHRNKRGGGRRERMLPGQGFGKCGGVGDEEAERHRPRLDGEVDALDAGRGLHIADEL